MKTNKYSNLLRFGLTPRTLTTLSESEINTLHKNLIEGSKQETKEVETVQTSITKYSKSEVDAAKTKGQSLPAGKAVKLNPDGSMDVTNEGEMSEGKKKKSKKIDAFAICTSQLGNEFGTTKRSLWTPKQNNKYERCVKAIKQSVTEGNDVTSVFLENKILSLIEKHIQPKMSKGDLMDLINKKTNKVTETTKEAPVKTPVKTPSKPDKDSPYKPKVSPAPKARKSETIESTETAPSKPAPTTKPGTKTPPKPEKGNPYQPKTSPNPKASTNKSMPSWMSFDTLGIKLKK
jgi:hypothetical protein